MIQGVCRIREFRVIKESQGIGLRLKSIKEKSENSADVRDHQGNATETVIYVSSIKRFPNMP